MTAPLSRYPGIFLLGCLFLPSAGAAPTGPAGGGGESVKAREEKPITEPETRVVPADGTVP